MIEQSEVVGHAVRAMYLFCGIADVAAATNDDKYLPALDKLWGSVALRKMYVTGGIGSRHSGEAFGDNYELPNDTAYCETCAAIGNGLWNHRMNLLYADAKYADVLERVLYNGFLSGVSLYGDHFFYVNPLASRGSHHRQAWYGCACCPSNVVRFLPSLPGYVYATSSDAVYVNLYMASTAQFKLGELPLSFAQETRYPWDGNVKFTVGSAGRYDINLRIPAWCSDAAIKINGEWQKIEMNRGYARLARQWKSGDVIVLDLPMPIQRAKADPQVKADTGRVAIQRGPVVYCVEAADNDGRVYQLSLPADSMLAAEYRADLLGGVTVIKGKAAARYAQDPANRPADVLAIPYFAWDNRTPGQMLVWLPEDASLAEPVPAPTIAGLSKVTASHIWERDSVVAVNDQIEPKSSNDETVPRFTWWPHKGSDEWVQYDFASSQKVSEVEVYWFDDTGHGGCRVPASWRLLYKDGEEWKPVKAAGEYGIARDKYNKLAFEPIQTSALRIAVKLQDGMSGGMLEWKVK